MGFAPPPFEGSRSASYTASVTERGAGTPLTILEGVERDRQLVTQEGRPVAAQVDGVLFRPAITHADERGSLTEIFSSAWSFTDDPLVHVYEVRILPGQIKGWLAHSTYDDRLYFANGCAKVALYDAREGSRTEGLVAVRFVGAHDRGLLVIPRGVYHAIRNVGADDLTFINMPTRAYDYANPDKYRLPADSSAIPYVP
jgi:dTDP-4-dehydrorhamnose 3,5-epimerase